MIRWITFLVTILVAATFWFFVPVEAVQKSAASVITALSIVTAAVFVRLNRGMPSLDWKTISAASKRRLTTGILDITKEYVAIIAINSIFVIFTIVMVGLGNDYFKGLSHVQKELVSLFSGAFVGLSFSRMAYVVWRDYDIVKLQKLIIDAAADQENFALETKSAVETVGRIGAANLRVQPRIQPKDWSDR